MRDRRVMKVAELERARVRADQAHARLADFLPVRQARGVELQWLVRRAFCRGLGEPQVDGLHEPRALVFERNGEAMLAPLEGDVMRWMDGYVEHRGRALKIESETGTSWQAQLVVGALPEQAQFPGARVELMFAPPESLPFGIDLSLNARFLPNGLALRIARRRIQDADQIVRAESDGEQGVSDLGYQRTQEARDLLAYLQSSSRPPLLRATLAIAIGARGRGGARGARGDVQARLRRDPPAPPARRSAAAVHAAPARAAHEGRGLRRHADGRAGRGDDADRRPRGGLARGLLPRAHARRDRGSRSASTCSEGSDSDRNTTILSVGALGSGKTTLDQKLKYEGFLQGARIIDCDPKGDHRFHLLEEVAPHTECVTLKPDPALRGVLDPLRVAPEHLRQDAAVSFLRDLLPGRAEPAWETAVVGAVDRVLRRSREPTCLEVVRALEQGDETDAQVGKTLEVYARSGLTQLGFADPAVKLPPVGQSQVTYLPIRDLPGPAAGDEPRGVLAGRARRRADRAADRDVRDAPDGRRARAAEAVLLRRGLAAAGGPGRPAAAGLAAADGPLGAGGADHHHAARHRRAGRRARVAGEPARGDVRVRDALGGGGGARAARCSGWTRRTGRMRQSLLEFEAGRCLFRDHSGRVEAIQVDVVLPSLLRAFSTTPGVA